MVLDEALLTVARAKHDDLLDAEKKAAMARAEFHYAVRQLHLAGAPVREVASAVGLSHQRVQQIVQAGGGTWWSRAWRGRNAKRDMACSFCGLPPSKIDSLLAGPRVYICGACVTNARDALDEPSPGNAFAPVARSACSFCSRRSGRVAGSSEHRICEECLGVCRRILDERRGR